MSYDVSNFSIGLTSSFQNNFYYTSTHTKRLGEPFWSGTDSDGNISRFTNDPSAGGTRVYVENVEVTSNGDRQVANKMQFSIYGAYKFVVSEKFQVQPLVRYGITTFMGSDYKPQRSSSETFTLENGSFYEVGIRSEIMIGIERSIYFEIVRNSYDWNPKNFLEAVPHSDFSSSARLVKVNLGYRFGF